MNVPFATSAGEAGLVCQFRLVTVMAAVSWVPAAKTVTVPLVTTTPGQELVVPEPLTVLLLESLNCQFEYWAPLGALLTLHVTLPPRATDAGEQLRFMSLAPPLGGKSFAGQIG